jgi:uncharacterized membrane protein
MMLVVLTIIYFVASVSNLGVYLNVGVWISAAIGVLFIVLGNFLSKVKSNYFFGIRTPWTLASETVWNKTHRLGGKVFIMAGVLLAMSGLSPERLRLPLFAFAIMIILFGTVVYSYLAYLGEKNGKK